MRLRISGKDLENLKTIMGYEISVPKAIAKTQKGWGITMPQERVEELSDFMREMHRRLVGE